MLKNLIKKILDRKNKKTQIFRYLPVAVIATIGDFSILYFLVSKLGIYYLVGAFFGVLFGLVINHLLCINFVFEDRKFKKLNKEIIFLGLITIVSIFLTLWFVFVFTDIFKMFYMVSRGITMFIVFAWNFLARKYIIFK